MKRFLLILRLARAIALPIALVPAAVGLCALASCGGSDLYCDETTPCRNPSRPYCDRYGVTEESGGHGKTCVSTPLPADAGPPDGSQVDAGLPDADAALPDGTPTWSPPELLANVNSSVNDVHPSISRDGLTLYFSSSRVPTAGQGDIWSATRPSVDQAFGPPQSLGAVNTMENERWPEISDDGLELFFVRDGGDGIMRSTRASTSAAWGAAAAVGINGQSPSLSSDGLALYYVDEFDQTVSRVTRTAVGQPSGPPEIVPLLGLRFRDIDVSANENGILLSAPIVTDTPTLMEGSRASPADDFSTFVPIAMLADDMTLAGAAWSRDRREIYFAATRAGGAGFQDIYVTRRVP